MIENRIAETNRIYRALINSASFEYNNMIRIHHARVVSRIGYVTQDMQDLLLEVTEAIDSRAVEIGNPEAQCILDARRGLDAAASQVGFIFENTARDWDTELHILNDNFVGPLIEELEQFISIFQIEVLMVMNYYNTVTELETIVSLLYLESVLYNLLFEIFVNELMVDFIIFEYETNHKNGRLFPLLDASLELYRFEATIIRNSLVNCNA